MTERSSPSPHQQAQRTAQPSRLIALDIETDTSGGGGLDPRSSSVTMVGLAFSDGRRLLLDDADETTLLTRLDGLLADEVGFLVTWNGSGFDLPFLDTRFTRCNVRSRLVVWQDDSLEVKYPPHDGLVGPVSASWGRLEHVDIAPMWRRFAEEQGVAWGLKPVARAFGLDPVEVDRSQMHLLDAGQLSAYALSDVEVTLTLASALDVSLFDKALSDRAPF